MNDETFSLIIPAAGSGSRMGLDSNKLLIPLAGKPVLWHTVRAFSMNPRLCEIVVVVRPEEKPIIQEILRDLQITVPVHYAIGGFTRQQSVLSGLYAAQSTSYVWVHDGARPFVSQALQQRILEKMISTEPLTVAVPVKDTIKRVSQDGTVLETLNRSELWSIQTPQIFQRELLIAAHRAAESAGMEATDDASLIEWFGHPVRIVMGDYQNIKLTTPEDMIMGENILKTMKG